jgi:uncharacterized protein with PQ loop repeat
MPIDHHTQTHVHKTKFKHMFVDGFAYTMGVLGPAMTLVQSYKIWSTQSAASLSLITWIFYLLMAISWLIYGLTHKERLIIFSNSIWLLVHASVILGIILYG